MAETEVGSGAFPFLHYEARNYEREIRIFMARRKTKIG
jgi:hypothetical protein